MELTKRQAQTFAIIKSFYADNSYYPTLKEIRLALGVKSDGGIMKHLYELEKKGYISRPRNTNSHAASRMMHILK